MVTIGSGQVVLMLLGTGVLEWCNMLNVFPHQEQAKKLVAWSADDVCLWLTTLGLDQYCEAFKQNAIDGTELSVVTAETLATDLGIGKVISVPTLFM